MGTETSSPLSGCLTVNWDKSQNTNSSDWGGNFRLVWALSRGNAGFLVYLAGRSNGSGGMEFEGAAYVFGKEDGNQQWKAKSKLDLKQENKTLASGETLKNTFPKRGKGFSDDEVASGSENSESTFWHFLDGDGKIKTPDNNNSHFQRQSRWESTVSSGKTPVEIKEWSSNLDTWWKHFFDDGNLWNVSETVNGIKGRWS